MNPDDASRQTDHESLVAPDADTLPRSTSREVGLTFNGWLRFSRVTFGGLMPFSHPGTLAPKSAQERQVSPSSDTFAKPALQVQAVAPAWPAVPELSGHAAHSAPLLLANNPAAHSAQSSTEVLPLDADLPAAHAAHAAVALALYRPAGHCEQAEAPLADGVLVTEPAVQFAQSVAASAPGEAAYLPAKQAMQAAASSLPTDSTYLPATQ